jgi:sulfate adenylyltransferase
MCRADFKSVVDSMRLTTGAIFPLPIFLDTDERFAGKLKQGDTVRLVFEEASVGEVEVAETFTCDKLEAAAKVFGTTDRTHPGVARFLATGSHFIAGKPILTSRLEFDFSRFELTPAEARLRFQELGWETIAGFQTRNIPHLAHEYLQRMALEFVDGLFIHPIVGPKKRGDFTPRAIVAGYQALLGHCFPPSRVLLGVLSAPMWYAGPREAVFHAIIRRNYGCTHFIVGRDHAGVGGFYGKYDAQALLKTFAPELGIEVLGFCGPLYCRLCGGIVTEKTCRHATEQPDATREISGSAVRELLVCDGSRAKDLIRAEVVSALQGIELFIDQDDT